MRRIISVLALGAVCALALSATAWGAGGPARQHFGPYASSSPDSGTCGNTWANDTFDRDYTVDTRPNADGTYNVVEQFKNGSFTTTIGPSPGACETNPLGTLTSVISGKMQGTFALVVTPGVGGYNPGATCTAQCFSADFVTAFFGAGATYDVPSYDIHYNAGPNGDWKNASPDKGGDRGDITS